MRYTNRIFVLLLASIGTVALSAQTSREREAYCDPQSARKVEIDNADATILSFSIGEASLKDVQAKLGTAKITRVTQEEESDISVCYISPTDGTVLVFYSGSMGGWKDITWFALWSKTAAFPNASQCTPSARVSHDLSTASGLRLGLTQEQLERIAGKPTAQKSSSMKYDYVCRQKMTEQEIKRFKTANNWDVTNDPYFDRMSWIEVHFRTGKASRIQVGRTESY